MLVKGYMCFRATKLRILNEELERSHYALDKDLWLLLELFNQFNNLKTTLSRLRSGVGNLEKLSKSEQISNDKDITLVKLGSEKNMLYRLCITQDQKCCNILSS